VNNSEGNGDNNFDRADCMAEQPGRFSRTITTKSVRFNRENNKNKKPLDFSRVLIFFLRSGRDSNPRPTA
jgi:hypothetical protein